MNGSHGVRRGGNKRAWAGLFLLLSGFVVSFACLIRTGRGSDGSLEAFLTLLVSFALFRGLSMISVSSPTASMAMVMSTGVFVTDLAGLFATEVPSGILRWMTICVFLVWLFVMASYVRSFFAGEFRSRHLQSIWNRFAMGTWIAGSSVCAMTMFKFLPAWSMIARLMVGVNSLLWMLFIGLCVQNFLRLSRDRSIRVNGLLLLSVVSTQSLVIDLALIFDDRFPDVLFPVLTGLGGFFYLVSITLWLRSFLRHKMTLTDDWSNANCIIHGALSITGLAGVVSGVLGEHAAQALWGVTVLVFFVIEGVEMVRAVKRVRQYGLKTGLFVYDVSQWARNFTFGMLLAFTLNLPAESLHPGFAEAIHGFSFVLFGVVLTLLIVEGGLFFLDRLVVFRRGVDPQEEAAGSDTAGSHS